MNSRDMIAQPPAQGVNRRFSTFRAISALMLREMATRYGNSPGGFVWALVEPIGAIFIIAIAFSLLVRNPPLGNSFILFYASGFLPYTLFQSISALIARAISFSKPLLLYPVVTWVDAVFARFILNALTGILAMVIVMVIVLMIAETRISVNLLPLLLAVGLALLLGAGIGMLNCVLFALFPIWNQIWAIATRPLFIMSGVLFLYESMPENIRNILWFNPLLHVTGLFREGIYSTYHADYVNIPYVLACGLIPLALGTLLMSRYHRDILNQ